ncbi:tyrosine-type recombinase/integrase [Catellatospora coxensis]
MGFINKTPAGTYRANWRDPAGRQKAKTFTTKKEASAFLAETESALNRGTYLDPKAGKKRFGEFAKVWQASRHVEQRTSERTDSVMRIHVLPQWSQWPLAKIEHTEVQGWVNRLSEKLSPASVAKCFGALSMVLNAAVRARLIPINPCEGTNLPSTHKPQRPATAISRAQFDRLLATVEPRYRALVALAAGAGLRWGEPRPDVGSDRPGPGDAARGPGRHRVGRGAHHQAHSEVAGWCSHGADARFPGDRAAQAVRREGQPRRDGASVHRADRARAAPLDLPPARVAAALVRAGLLGSVAETSPERWRATWPTTAGASAEAVFATERSAVEHVAEHAAGGLRFHDLRHSYATWLVSDGLPVNVVQRVMGHESASTTLNLYTRAEHVPRSCSGRFRRRC